MSTFALHIARCTGLADVLDPNGLGFVAAGRIPVGIPRTRPIPPRSSTTGRPGGRPGGSPGGSPGGRRPGGGGGLGGGGKGMLIALGALSMEKLWAYRWYAIAGVGAYVLIRSVSRFRQRIPNVNVPASGSAVHSYGENVDAETILAAYLHEMLMDCPDLDVYTTTSSFFCYPSSGPSVAFYCCEHLHMKVVNHVNDQAPAMQVVKCALDRTRSMMSASFNESDFINEVSEGVSFCVLSKAGRGIGLLINQELGVPDFWDCCSENINEPVPVGRAYDSMSYLAARRLSPSGSLLENFSGDPCFIIFACDGINNLLQNMALIEFAYQGIRNGMPLRLLCETLLGLVRPSSKIRRAVILVQFKRPFETQQQHDQAPIDLEKMQPGRESEGSQARLRKPQGQGKRHAYNKY